MLPRAGLTDGFSTEELRKFVRYGIHWHRYACCAHDCGPVARSRGRFRRYAEVAEAIARTRPPCPKKADNVHRRWTQRILESRYSVLLDYLDAPLSYATRLHGLRRHRKAIEGVVKQAEANLKATWRSAALPES